MKSIRDEQVAYIAENQNTLAIVKNLAKEFTVEEIRTQSVSEKYFDTFEWSLYATDCLLKYKNGTLQLANTRKNQVISAAAKIKQKFFWWEIEDTALKNALKPVADIRALTEVVKVKTVRKHYDLRNKDSKTVVRLAIDYTIASNGGTEKELMPVVRVQQIRGYKKAYNSISSKLTALGLQNLDSAQSYLHYALTAVEREVLDYSSKFEIDLASNISIQEAVSQICLFLVRAMERNLPGVMDDIDSEFLHDFRIAVRRTRSLIGQMKKLVPAEEIQFFQNEFKWLGTITGPVRDLDVYLLKREEFRTMLPHQLHDGLDNFFSDLAKKRVEKLKIMREGLDSARYQKFMSAWVRFLTGKDGSSWPSGEEQCQPHAIKLIRKRLVKILKDGGSISSSTPDTELHRLRIQGKKLRYLLEFFRSFFATDEVDFFLKQLKKLQNNLGDFNDVSVQSDMLSGYLEDLHGRGKRSIQTAAAVGGLVTHLHNRHTSIRQKFEGTFAAFSTEDNEIKFKGMLS